MWRRFRRLLLPVLVIFFVAGVIFVAIAFSLYDHYRTASTAETARLLGAITEACPELDSSALIAALADDTTTTSTMGMDLLRAYGYTDADFVTSSTAVYSRALIVLSVLIIFGVIFVFAGYLWYRERRYRHQINDLVVYLQKLNDRVYDLRIKSNTEDELSLLANELYKITVTLKTAAEHDREIRQQLESALADISHQLKTPLTSLQVTLDNLESDPEMPLELRQDFLRASSHQVAAMADLVATLLNLAKFDNGTIKMQRRVMPISQILDQVYVNLEVLADLDGIKLQIQGDLDAQVKLDPRWQSEALTNIVKNCLEHSPAGSTVAITVRDGVLYTRVIIQDTGSGIAPADLHRIFERFYKAQNASPQSVGIGLAFAKSVIEADHGQIRVQSQLGVGTTFTVTYFH